MLLSYVSTGFLCSVPWVGGCGGLCCAVCALGC